jgi:hypothetical protein
MMHAGVVQHLEIDLICVKEAEECPEAKKYSPLQSIDLACVELCRFGAIIYLDWALHAI